MVGEADAANVSAEVLSVDGEVESRLELPGLRRGVGVAVGFYDLPVVDLTLGGGPLLSAAEFLAEISAMEPGLDEVEGKHSSPFAWDSNTVPN